MGATDLCPGTHMCGESNPSEICPIKSFQASGDDYWKAGSALFMNQQTFHRGAAHVDPNGPPRVLFIVTFAPRPMDMMDETRMLGQGGSYSLRWDMWGHTLDDFEQATTKMTQPWTTLRALGFYKPKDSDWGWDWIAQSSMRIANGDTGYYEEHLEEFVSKGALGLPMILSPPLYIGMTWSDYMADTVNLWKKVATMANILSYTVYISLTLFIGIIIAMKESRKTAFRNMFRSIGRVALLDAVIIALAAYVLYTTHESSWAKAIRGRTLYTSPFPPIDPPVDPRPLAVIFPNDVLITDSHDVKYLGSLSDVLEFQGGNTKYRSTINGASKIAVHFNAEDVGRLARNILSGMKREGSRLLFQNEKTDWVVLSESDSFQYTLQAILLEANPAVAALHKESRFLVSSYKHSLRYRNSGALAKKHSLINIHSVMNKIMANRGIPSFSLYDTPTTLFDSKERQDKTPKIKHHHTLQLRQKALLEPRKDRGTELVTKMTQSLPTDVIINDEGMLQIGDTVEAQYNGMYNEVRISFHPVNKTQI
jgi:hypothetical protein